MITVGKRDLEIQDVEHVLLNGGAVELDEVALGRAEASFQLLSELAKSEVIYGVNTGFGPMASCVVAPENAEKLQLNLIRSHAMGSGAPIGPHLVRAVLLARLTSLMQGGSGVHRSVLDLLAALINHDIYPIIPEHGGVGASGDLVQLAHVALTCIGEGKVHHGGAIVPAGDALRANNLEPIKPHLREGLALINGTSAMTGIGLLALFNARNLVRWTVLASCVMQEIEESYNDSFSIELNRAKRHAGQQRVAWLMTGLLGGSKRIRHRHHHLKVPSNGHTEFNDKVQDCYSIRCVPQILGPMYESLEHAEKVLLNELNSINDNPVVDIDNRNVLHGGNFHGEYVAQEMDKLRFIVTKLSMLCERQLNFLLNDRLNAKLPPFLNAGTLGLDLGLQGIQFTATSTVAENQTLSFPMSVHSIPCNKDNQDIVSMGANAALLTTRVIKNSYEVLAIEWIALLEAVDILAIRDELSPATRRIYNDLRAAMPRYDQATTTHEDVARFTAHLEKTRIPNLDRLFGA